MSEIVPYPFVFTDAGRAAIRAANELGLSLQIAELGVAAGGGFATQDVDGPLDSVRAMVALPGEFERASFVGGANTSANQVVLQATVPPGVDSYIDALGLYSDTGVLVAVASQDGGNFGHRSTMYGWVFKYVLTWTDLPLNAITVQVADEVASNAFGEAVTGRAEIQSAVEQSGMVWDSLDVTQLGSAIVGRAAGNLSNVSIEDFLARANAAGLQDAQLQQQGILNAFATAVLVDLNGTEPASSAYGAYYRFDMTQGGMIQTGAGSLVTGVGYVNAQEADLAQGKVAVASATAAGSAAANALDGDLGTAWYSPDSTFPVTWSIDTGVDSPSPSDFTQIEMVGAADQGIGNIRLHGSSDGVTWVFLGEYLDTDPNVTNAAGETFVRTTSEQAFCYRHYQVEVLSGTSGATQAAMAAFRVKGPGAPGEMVLKSPGLDLQTPNPSDFALFLLIDEAAAVTEGVDRIVEIATGKGIFATGFVAADAVGQVSEIDGGVLLRADFDVSALPSPDYTFRITVNNVDQTVRGAVLVPLYY